MQLRIDPGGTVRCVYAEAIDLTALGALTIVAIGLVPVLLLHQAVAGGRAGAQAGGSPR